ncbi:MAG: hypothetical protein O2827_05180 [Verrucomicrobia bacterium]|nr:hypothetical protein [Verrucomicrobiota bacterium]
MKNYIFLFLIAILASSCSDKASSETSVSRECYECDEIELVAVEQDGYIDNVIDSSSLMGLFNSLDDAGKEFVVKNFIKQGIPEFDSVVIEHIREGLDVNEQEFEMVAKSFKSSDAYVKFMIEGMDSNMESEIAGVLKRYWNAIAVKSTDAAGRLSDNAES